MTNQKSKPQKPEQLLTPINKERFYKNRISAVDYYGEDYMDKLLKVTRGRVLHDYVGPRFSLPRKNRR